MRIDVTYAGEPPRVIETAGEGVLSPSAMERSPEWAGQPLPVTAVMLRPRTDLLREGGGLVVEVCAWSSSDAGGRPRATLSDLGGVTEVPRMLFHVFRVWEVLPASEVARAVAIDIDGRIHVRRLGGAMLDITAYERLEADLLSGSERGGLALDQRVLVVHDRLRALHPGSSDEELGDLYGLGGALHDYALSLAGDGGAGEDGGMTGEGDDVRLAGLLDELGGLESIDERADFLVGEMLSDERLTLEALQLAGRARGADAVELAEAWAEAERRISDEGGWDDPTWDEAG